MLLQKGPIILEPLAIRTIFIVSNFAMPIPENGLS